MIKAFKSFTIQRNDAILSIFALSLYFSAIGKYGLKILILLLISIIIGFLTEKLSYKIRKKEDTLYGLPIWIMFPLVFPPVFPLWMSSISIFFGILVSIAFFGGYGKHLVSPIALGWSFAVLSFPTAFGFGWSLPFPSIEGFGHFNASVLTIDHPLIFFKNQFDVPILNILVGNFPQSPATAIPIVLIGCGVLLLVLRVIDFRTVASFFITMIGLSVIFRLLLPSNFQPLSSLLIGDLLFAGIFILPDKRISGRTHEGKVFIGVLIGAIAFLIRSFSSFPDGIFFAVLFGNAFSAIIEEGVLKFKHRRGLKE